MPGVAMMAHLLQYLQNRLDLKSLKPIPGLPLTCVSATEFQHPFFAPHLLFYSNNNDRCTYKLYILHTKYILIKFRKKYYSYNIIQIIFNFIYLEEIIFLIFKIFSLLKDYRYM